MQAAEAGDAEGTLLLTREGLIGQRSSAAAAQEAVCVPHLVPVADPACCQGLQDTRSGSEPRDWTDRVLVLLGAASPCCSGCRGGPPPLRSRGRSSTGCHRGRRPRTRWVSGSRDTGSRCRARRRRPTPTSWTLSDRRFCSQLDQNHKHHPSHQEPESLPGFMAPPHAEHLEDRWLLQKQLLHSTASS